MTVPREENKGKVHLLSDDTFCLARYQGEGFITLSNQQKISCSFEVGQLRRGDVFIYCNVGSFDTADPFSLYTKETYIKSFDGETDDGLHIATAGSILWRSFSNDHIMCRLQEFSVEKVKDANPYVVRFGITNLELTTALSIQLEHQHKLITIQIQPIEQYVNVIERMETLRSPDVTCEAIVTFADFEDKNDLEQIINNLCYLLSVAKGTKIQWIYQAFYDHAGMCFFRRHASRVTKVYVSSPLISSGRDTQAFIEGTYSIYVANRERYKLDEGIIDAYLDAKADNDYLQVRGIKLAVTMEIIKDVFINLSDSPVEEFLTKKSRFKKIIQKLVDAISPLLKDAHIEITEEILQKKLLDLNRRDFRDILHDIFERVHLEIEDEQKSRFIQCRNSLVHRGCFRCEVVKQHAVSQEDMIEEYFFLENVLDRVFLKLLGYHGAYWDRSIPENPVYKGKV